MPALNWRAVSWTLGAATLGIIAFTGRGQGQATIPAVLAQSKAQDRISGADNCIRCHKEPLPADKQPGGATDFLRMDESTIWDTQDMHKKAFEALKTPLGVQMGQILKTDVSRDVRCLTCHSVDLVPEKKLAAKVADEFYTPFGVGCEACHGFSKVWFLSHAKKDWRELPVAEKEKQGLWDMRDPMRRAERCTSCHVGSEPDGRFVTHEMYAAGHPPLPSIEVMAFSRDQKMHYLLAKDLPYLQKLAKDDPDKCWRLFHFRGADAESQVARQTAVGAIMSLRAAAKLLTDRAGGLDASKEALDLAHFDCYACHHDLQSPSWRQARGYVGVPGRPQIRPGVALMAKLVAEHAASALNADASSPLRTFPESFKVVTDAFDARPFGDPAKVSEAAKGLVAWCDEVLKQLDNVRYNREQTAKLLKHFVDAGQAQPEGKTNPWLDADAAQQLVWSVESLRTELEGPDGPIAQTLDSLKTKLPREVRDTSKTDFLATQLGGRLKRQYEFTPEELHAAFAKVAGIVK
jgi:hypothetical protein